ncbi:hypothetical protein VTP01DRAFT_9048 [Rhizomucor pusillus]|uniref:uncharacterized protein n=1 Tax=Rhizomucor pusillus TaxID=4840 RepID=UPI0037439E6B
MSDSKEPIVVKEEEDLTEMDNVDTDDLLEEAEATLKPLKQTRKTRRTRMKKTKGTEDMDVDPVGDNSGSDAPKTTRSRRKASSATTATSKRTKANGKSSSTQPDKGKKPAKPVYDPMEVKALADQYPDSFWRFHADSGYDMIDTINEQNPLEPVQCNISDQAPITSMNLSPDGALLATFSNIGAAKIWDIQDDFKLVRKLRDNEETQIDEFYCGQFVTENQELLVVGGKLKDRHRWSAQDEDNHILPCPIKIFDIESGKVVSRLEGHAEEILCIKALTFKDENYLISTSQDGYIFKWHMSSDWKTLIESSKMEDGVTCMAFTVSFLPNTGNKYFLAACDEHIRLFDFESGQMMQTFEDMYSSYCDCGKFVTWLDEFADKPVKKEEEEEIDIDKMDEDPAEQYAWFITRGAEMCDVEEGVSSIPNTCKLHKLIYPKEKGGQFKLEQVKKYQHEDYHANSWLVKITSNGRYILAPTIYGQIFVFNMSTGQVTAILKEHEDIEVRDVIFHPYRPLIFSSGDDGFVKVYTSKTSATEEQVEQDLDVGMPGSS